MRDLRQENVGRSYQKRDEQIMTRGFGTEIQTTGLCGGFPMESE